MIHMDICAGCGQSAECDNPACTNDYCPSCQAELEDEEDNIEHLHRRT